MALREFRVHQVISKRIVDDHAYSLVAKDKKNVYACAMCRVIDGYSGIQCNHRHCYFKIITLNEPKPLAYHDL